MLRGARHDGAKFIPGRETRHRYLIEVTLQVPLQLAQLVRPELTRLAPDRTRPPDLSAAWPIAYPITRAWAQALYDNVPAIDGFRYESHMVPGHSFIVYDRNTRPLFAVVGDPVHVREGQARELLLEQADRAGIAIDLEDELP